MPRLIHIELDEDELERLLDCVEFASERYGYHQWFKDLLTHLLSYLSEQKGA